MTYGVQILFRRLKLNNHWMEDAILRSFYSSLILPASVYHAFTYRHPHRRFVGRRFPGFGLSLLLRDAMWNWTPSLPDVSDVEIGWHMVI